MRRITDQRGKSQGSGLLFARGAIHRLRLSRWEPDNLVPRFVLNGTQVGTDCRKIGLEFPCMLHPIFPDEKPLPKRTMRSGGVAVGPREKVANQGMTPFAVGENGLARGFQEGGLFPRFAHEPSTPACRLGSMTLENREMSIAAWEFIDLVVSDA